jgi:hypothetical protein
MGSACIYQSEQLIMEQKVSLERTKVRWGDCKCGAVKRAPKKGGCRNIHTQDPVEKPDLAIYSQLEEISKGNVPAWDSPDIVTNNWRPFRLMQEARVKIRNLSPTVPAINALVHYAISSFGIGIQVVPQLSQAVNVPAGSEIELFFPLYQETLNGDPRVGVHIAIEHPHDPILINNKGSQVHDGGFTTESGRNFKMQVPVYNNSSQSRDIHLSLMPTEMVATIAWSSHVFAPHEQKLVELSIKVPNHLHGTADNFLSRSVTLVGRLSNNELIGGITRLIRIDD